MVEEINENIRAGDKEVTQVTKCFLFKLQAWDQNAHVKNSDKVVCVCNPRVGRKREEN